MIVVWTANAKRELRAAYDTIARTSERYAIAMVDRITGKTADLVRFPLFGAEVPEYGDGTIREVFEHPYRVIYRVRPDRIEIVSVVHAARLLPADPPDGA
jgi:toxin ParE1/3/4